MPLDPGGRGATPRCGRGGGGALASRRRRGPPGSGRPCVRSVKRVGLIPGPHRDASVLALD